VNVYFNKFFDYLESKLFGSKEARRIKYLERQAYIKEKEKQAEIIGKKRAELETEFVVEKIKNSNHIAIVNPKNGVRMGSKNIYDNFKREDDKMKRMVGL